MFKSFDVPSFDISSFYKKNTIYGNYSNIFYDKEEGKNFIGIPFNDYWFDIYDVYIIKPEEEYRPDLLSQKFYNSPAFDWVICLANFIKDPLSELYAGRKIAVPKLPEEYMFEGS